MNYYSPSRRRSNVVRIGKLSIGGSFPIAVQTMCNTPTSDVPASCAQIQSMCRAGADLIRLTVPTMADADALELIHSKDVPVPLCADVHFKSSIAFRSVSIVEKVRVNPGNFAKEAEVDAKFTELLHLAAQNHVAIRVGVNHGSLSSYMLSRWGDTPRGMAESALEFMRIAKREGFDDVVVSLKSSNPRIMVESYRLCASLMEKEEMYFPLHLGVTEAGEGVDGRVRSAVGIGALLADGMGDTLRVSLTEDPVEEIPVGRVLSDYFMKVWNDTKPITDQVPLVYDPLVFKRRTGVLPVVVGRGGDFETVPEEWFHVSDVCDLELCPAGLPVVISSDRTGWVGHVRYLISCMAQKGLDNPVVLHRNYVGVSNPDIVAAAEMGAVLIDGIADGVWIEKDGIPADSSLGYSILQAARLRTTHAEIISCPGCGRTQYDLQKVAKDVKERFSGYANLKIAVMGCIVNGPGEMSDADWGYVGAGGGKVSIYKGHDVAVAKVDQSEALDLLEKLIKEDQNE